MKLLGVISTVTLLALLLVHPGTVLGHHGVASLGVAGIEGPGAPLETSSSATLPERGFLFYTKLDYADFKTFTSRTDDETDYNAFWMYGLGIGLRPYLSLYLFLPYNTKIVEDNSFNTSGFADISAMGVLGFKYDEGFLLVPADESLDDLEDWHFTIYGGTSIPTGNPNVKDPEGEIDPGMSLGFGRPAVSIGTTATKLFGGRYTAVMDLSEIIFSEFEHSDGNRNRFGDEFRLGLALTHRLFTRPEAHLRLDWNIEMNYLRLGRDIANGVPESGTGGDMLYLLPGMRLYYKSISAGFGVKLPTWKNLNEESTQQGAEGKENYRLIFSFSSLM
jgi:hypothetical protein